VKSFVKEEVRAGNGKAHGEFLREVSEKLTEAAAWIGSAQRGASFTE